MSLLKVLLPLIAVCLLLAGGARAAEVTVRDGNTIELGDITYRLEGTDAPELDQTCIDAGADPWTCGIDARDQLTKIIGGRIGSLRRSRSGQGLQEAAYRPVPDRGRDREPEPAAGALRLCAGL